MATREAFLQRVRQAVRSGSQQPPPLPTRGTLGYQGAGADAIQRFRTELAAAGGQSEVVADPKQARTHIIDILQTKNARRVLLSGDPVIDKLDLLRFPSLEVRDGRGKPIIPPCINKLVTFL